MVKECRFLEVSNWQPARIAATIEPITDLVAEGAAGLGLEVPAKAHRAPHIVYLRKPSGFPPDIMKRLAAKGVYVSARGGGLRVSPYVYNDIADAERLLDALKAAI